MSTASEPYGHHPTIKFPNRFWGFLWLRMDRREQKVVNAHTSPKSREEMQGDECATHHRYDREPPYDIDEDPSGL